jgi:glycosyl transferase family 2
MNRIDNKEIPENKNEVRLFMVGVDAADLIPHVFKHYFDIGVDRIFYIDNDSTDDSLEVLARYDRVHVWVQDEPFSGCGTPAKSGAAWMESLMCRHGVGNWCLLADTDELFVYPNFESTSIREFVAEQDSNGYDCVTADFIDMYSDKKVKDTIIDGLLLETCPYTDRDGGSCRERVLGFRPVMVKMPLFRFSTAITVKAGFHAVLGFQRMSDVRCAVLHFKFLSGFPARLAAHGHKMTDIKIKRVVYNDIGEVNFYDEKASIRFQQKQ